VQKILLTAGLLILALVVQELEPLKHWDDQIFDAELMLLSRPAKDDIIIIAIDEPSLQKLGKWPWSRSTHAELINLLTVAQVKAIGMDIIFAERDPNDPAADRALVEAVRNNGRVILPVFPEMSNSDKTLRVTVPFRELANVAAGLGHVDVQIDSDGVVRSAYLLAGMGQYWPSFSFALSMLDEQNQRPHLKGARKPVSAERFSTGVWRRDFRIEVPFANGAGHFSQISYADVLTDPNLRTSLRGKYILVGATAAGLGQMFMTPMYRSSGMISGVEVNANILEVLLEDIGIETLHRLWNLIITSCLVLIPVVSSNYFFPRQILPISLVFCGLAISLSFWLLKELHYWYSPLSVLSILTINYLLWIWQRFQFFTKSLFKEKQLAKATLHSVADAVITTDANGFIAYMNPAAEKLTGFTLKVAQGLLIGSIVRFINNEGQGLANQFDDFINSLSDGRPVKEIEPRYIVNLAGDEYAVQINGSPIVGESNKISGLVFAFSDITETLHINNKINYLASHDPLTGLSNRVFFYDQIEKALAYCQRHGNYLALLFIDLDDFKKINDGMGHPVGDALLVEVAERLLGNMRQTDTVARWGGDEFVVLLNQLPQEEHVTGIAIKILEYLSRPYFFEGQTLYVTPSIGVSIFPKDGSTTEELLAHADAALFHVKENGRNNFSFFCQGFHKFAKERLDMEKEMYCALAEDQFEVYYQPQVELKTNRIIGAEALLRWNHPSKGIISPDIFIPLAEKTGLINQIGDWVLQTVCKQLNVWLQQGLTEIPVAINLSARQFLQHDLCDKIHRALEENDVKARLLKVEITESLMIKNVEKVTKMLWDIKALGVCISVDDFGTGYSSLSAIKNFPIDQLKIDKSFISQLATNPDDANIAQSIIMLGHNMCMNVVAEGVENQTQLACLQDWNCDFIQGYYFSVPLIAIRMTELLQQGGFINKLSSD